MKRNLLLLLALLFLWASPLPVLAGSDPATAVNPFARLDRERQEKIDQIGRQRVHFPIAVPPVPEFQEQLNQRRRDKIIPDQSRTDGQSFLVRFRPEISLDMIHDLLRHEDYQLAAWSHLRLFQLESDDIDAFMAKAGDWLIYAEPDQLLSLQAVNDPYFDQQWALEAIAAPQAWTYTTGNPNDSENPVMVAVIDTGIHRSHPDLIHTDIRDGRDFLTGGPSLQDYHGHGTWVTGVIAADTNNHLGIAGVCHDISVLPLSIVSGYNDKGEPELSAHYLTQAIYWAADAGAKVVNMSVGGPTFIQSMLDAAAYAEEQGCILVAAAGNTGRSVYQYPAAYEPVIAVAAIDANLEWVPFSTWHDQIDLAAPGYLVLTTTLPDQYGLVSGTSFSAPHVAAAAALAASLEPSLDRDLFMHLIRKTSLDLGEPGYDHKTGHGLLDAGKIMARLATAVQVMISGLPRYGETLAASPFGLIPDDALLAYQWYRNEEALAGMTADGYVVTREDIGQAIQVSLTMTSDDQVITVFSNPVIAEKAVHAAPAAPELAARTDHEIILQEQAGCQYRIHGGSWQDSPVFSGLNRNTNYRFYARLAESPTHQASTASSALNTRTLRTSVTGSVRISGTARYGETLSADTRELQPAGATLSYQWYRGTTTVGSKASYTVTAADIGANLYLTVSGTGDFTSSLTSPAVIPAKAAQSAPDAPALAERTHFSLTVQTQTGLEYRLENGSWQTGGVFRDLDADKPYRIYARRVASTTHQASPASPALAARTAAGRMTSATLHIDTEKAIISRISLETRAQDLLSALNDGIGMYAGIYQDGKPLAAQDLVGTGMLIHLQEDGRLLQELTLVVTGDITGNGQAALTDFVQMRAHLLNKSRLSGNRAYAADINGDAQITLTDFIRLKAHLLGQEKIKPQAH